MSKKKPAKSRDSYHHDNLRSELIVEALKFLKSGRAEDLSLRELARRVGVSHMAPYRHFESKEDLLAEIIEAGFKKLSSMFDQAQKGFDQDFRSLFAHQGRAYIQFVIDNPDQARLMFSGLLCDPKRHINAHKAGQETFGRLIQLIELGQSQGHIRKTDNPYMLGLMIWSAVHGSAMLMIENQFGMIEHAPAVDVDRYVEFMSDRMLAGLR